MNNGQIESREQLAEDSHQTRRETSPGLEKRLYERLPVLDHGFIRVVDYMGTDASVVQAARVSYGRGTKRVSEDRGLINYLMRHHHTTPFEMAEIKLHVKLPIFVARQWIRHRTASVNEYSARYSVLDKEFYLPSAADVGTQSVSNKQGRQDGISQREIRSALELLKRDAENSYKGYLELLNVNEDGSQRDASNVGLARELARANLTLGFYTQWYWKTNLHNLMNFLRLRADPHAQSEIRAYADVIIQLMKEWVPMTYEAFIEHRMGAATFSASALRLLKRMLAGESMSFEESQLTSREWAELMEKIRP